MKEQYLFVYGTLRERANHPMHKVIQQSCRLMGSAFFRGRLYQLERYPAAIESDDKKDYVWGEVYQLVNPETALPFLDSYEGCTDQDPLPHEYQRQLVDVTLYDHRRVKAWVYIYVLKTDGLHCIESGDYLKFVKAKRVASS
ncbi:MAG: gamma-glutamylcyclotransferase family protein [Endozoicomonas sp.]|uniref:gamma-glutamylcyclotransferase family protein n=1 Tax=Endozoicomonas sp. TaxID=1892382 RepID=UPI003D9AF5A3